MYGNVSSIICCLASNCAYASIKREKKTKNYVVYVETEKYWYCLLHQDGDFTSSDTQSTCATTNHLPPTDDTCVDITNKGLGLNEEQYKGLRYGCTGATNTGKRNLQDGTDTVIDLSTSSYEPFNVAAFNQTIMGEFSKFAKLREYASTLDEDKKECVRDKVQILNQTVREGCLAGTGGAEGGDGDAESSSSSHHHYGGGIGFLVLSSTLIVFTATGFWL